MRTNQLRRPSPALIVSILALFVALGGTSYAALNLPPGSVGTQQLTNGAVTTRKIKNRAVTAAKLNVTGVTVPNALHAATATSATTAQSATTAMSATTADAATTATTATSAANATTAGTVTGQGTLASGKTEIGIVGARFETAAANTAVGITVSFPLIAPHGLDDPHVQIAPTANCSGSTSNPTAAAGFVCVYPDNMLNATAFIGFEPVTFDTELGFQLDWTAPAAGNSRTSAEWAYTAP